MKRPSRRARIKPKVAVAALSVMTEDERGALAAKVRYCGSPYHKRNPADYGMPESRPRPDKTLCDAERPLGLKEAEALLRAGIAKGLFSEQFRGAWPQNVWSVDAAGTVYEAQLQNSESGEYHGYPMLLDTGLAEHIRREWELREQ